MFQLLDRDPLRLVGFAAALLLVAGTGGAGRAEIKTVVDRKKAYHATPAFCLQNVPPPSAGDAAGKAVFTLVDGEADPHCGGLAKLSDGKLPRHDDDPAENFFFNAGTPGGRIAVDLGKLLRVKQVNTYSWHADARGPQVYKLFGSDGAAAGFNPGPKAGTDPRKCGWKLICAVDTRPAKGYLDGQYGASISDSGGVIGKYRYLLLDVSRTENDDAFGNTFYSEMDVIDAEAPPAPAPALPPPTVVKGPPKYEVSIDCSEMPELKQWAQNELGPTLTRWYPIIVAALPGEDYAAPEKVTVTIKKDPRILPGKRQGVAFTVGSHVVCSGPWLKANLEGEARGAVVHELAHVAQQIRGRHAPSWLIEGVADYIRWFQYEPKSHRPRPDPRRAKPTDGYRTTAAFLDYLSNKYDERIVARLNAAMRESDYSDALFKEYTGKEMEELWREYVATLR
ncbi:MAG: hypothetical protein JW809_00250 [Pirellulales bacterium]|nr:hypothetical protein [Pirellulales bacterium]